MTLTLIFKTPHLTLVYLARNNPPSPQPSPLTTRPHNLPSSHPSLQALALSLRMSSSSPTVNAPAQVISFGAGLNLSLGSGGSGNSGHGSSGATLKHPFVLNYPLIYHSITCPSMHHVDLQHPTLLIVSNLVPNLIPNSRYLTYSSYLIHHRATNNSIIPSHVS